AFLKTQFAVGTVVFMTIALLLMAYGAAAGNTIVLYTGAAYIVGAVSSALVSIAGMYVAILRNIRVLNALARRGLRRALALAFRGGSVTGFLVGGVGLLGVSLLFKAFYSPGKDLYDAVAPLLGYAFGASTVALFARVGGGIYTKAADVGADLVGKVAIGIPEDDPRNPGVIADNVGDNVGDGAGMGADLFESYVESIVAAMVIASVIGAAIAPDLVALPLVLASAALLATMLAAQFVEFSPISDPARTLTATSVIGILLVMVFTAAALGMAGMDEYMGLWGAMTLGLIAGGIVGFTSDYFTSPSSGPVKTVARHSRAGPALTILSGMSMGFYSTFIPIVAIALAALGAYHLGESTLADYGAHSYISGISAIAL
ncbi:MAG: sodium/proton-translocating pyrophosphatase, partial [Candidatus Korarchaeota archaeon]|nr:sodium/proton-translocating pyrophosphatase [Candidatus Korarchaeota archaeon]